MFGVFVYYAAAASHAVDWSLGKNKHYNKVRRSVSGAGDCHYGARPRILLSPTHPRRPHPRLFKGWGSCGHGLFFLVLMQVIYNYSFSGRVDAKSYVRGIGSAPCGALGFIWDNIVDSMTQNPVGYPPNQHRTLPLHGGRRQK